MPAVYSTRYRGSYATRPAASRSSSCSRICTTPMPPPCCCSEFLRRRIGDTQLLAVVTRRPVDTDAASAAFGDLGARLAADARCALRRRDRRAGAAGIGRPLSPAEAAKASAATRGNRAWPRVSDARPRARLRELTNAHECSIQLTNTGRLHNGGLQACTKLRKDSRLVGECPWYRLHLQGDVLEGGEHADASRCVDREQHEEANHWCGYGGSRPGWSRRRRGARSVAAHTGSARVGTQASSFSADFGNGVVTNVGTVSADYLVPLTTDSPGNKNLTFTSRATAAGASCRAISTNRFGTGISATAFQPIGE